MAIEPDTKDWTWVLGRPCPQCGFDAAAFDLATTGDAVRSNAQAWASLLADGRAVRVRPDDATWSPLEYACHVRDVFRLFLHRLDRITTEDDPLFANWDQDVTAVEERYDEQDPAVVADETVRAGADLAHAVEALRPDQMDRPGRRSDGAVFTVDSFLRYLLHDPLHHLWDVTGTRADRV